MRFRFKRKKKVDGIDETWSTLDRLDEIEAQREADLPLNRRQRRMYNRLYVPDPPTPEEIRKRRGVRIHLVGFGRWRRHYYLRREPIAPSPHVGLAPRAARRPAAVRAARNRRRFHRKLARRMAA